MKNKRRKIIHAEGRAMIARVYHFLKSEYEFTLMYRDPKLDLTHLRNITKRTADATGVGERTVQKILKEEKDLSMLKPLKKNTSNLSEKLEKSDVATIPKGQNKTDSDFISSSADEL